MKIEALKRDGLERIAALQSPEGGGTSIDVLSSAVRGLGAPTCLGPRNRRSRIMRPGPCGLPFPCRRAENSDAKSNRQVGVDRLRGIGVRHGTQMVAAYGGVGQSGRGRCRRPRLINRNPFEARRRALGTRPVRQACRLVAHFDAWFGLIEPEMRRPVTIQAEVGIGLQDGAERGTVRLDRWLLDVAQHQIETVGSCVVLEPSGSSPSSPAW